MNVLKLIAGINWAIIVLLACIAVGMVFFSNKGGDAATKGMGEGIGYFAAFVMVVLLVLNLLPWNWTKYTALALVVVPIAVLILVPSWRKLNRHISNAREAAKPIFEDEARERLARVIADGKPRILREQLQTVPAPIREDAELLAFAIGEAAYEGYRPQEKLECVRILIEAGADVKRVCSMDETPIHIQAASAGNSGLLQLLLENGADANAYQVSFERSILFEAIGSYREVEACVRILLKHGADPNATAVFDHERGPITPLLRAAQLERWAACALLLEHGADSAFVNAQGTNLRTFIRYAEGPLNAETFRKYARPDK